MLRIFYPNGYADSVFDIDYECLYQKGFRGIIFDIDNTLVRHGDDSTPRVDEFFRKLQKIGLRTLLLSNNDEARVKRFLKNIDSLYICNAGKPQKDGYLRAVEKMGLSKKETVCIGDQIFTDILGANRSGIAAILVHYIRAPGETRIGIRRHLEKIVLWFYRHDCFFRERMENITVKEAEHHAVEQK